VDELTLDGTGVMYDVTPDRIDMRRVDPAALGLRPAKTSAIGGGDPATNARLVEGVLRGEPGARRDVVLLNAGAALFVAGRAASLREGLALAASSIDGGAAARTLAALCGITGAPA
jgi:anthranilate phosphoribosyltransferase